MGFIFPTRRESRLKLSMFDTQPCDSDVVDRIVSDALGIIDSAAVPPNPKDPAVTVYQCRLRPSEMRAIALQEYLDPQPQWGIKINLANLYLGSERVNAIARSLILNKTVTSLDLSTCDLRTSGCCDLFHCLQRNTGLKHLNINGNFIEAEGAAAAATCIGKLETLHMGCNPIGDRGAIALAQALENSDSLKFLSVRGCGLSKYGVYCLVAALDPTALTRCSESLKDDLAAARRQYQKECHAAVAAVRPADSFVQSSAESSSPLAFTRSSQFSTPLAKRPLTITLNASGPVASGTSLADSERKLSPQSFSNRRSVQIAQQQQQQHNSDASFSAPVERPPTPLFVSESTRHNTSCNALWVHANIEIPQELLDNLNGILTKRVPQPPEGFNAKKKKGKGKGKKS